MLLLLEPHDNITIKSVLNRSQVYYRLEKKRKVGEELSLNFVGRKLLLVSA